MAKDPQPVEESIGSFSPDALRLLHQSASIFEDTLAEQSRSVARSRGHELVLKKDVEQAKRNITEQAPLTWLHRAAQITGPLFLGLVGDPLYQAFALDKGLSAPYIFLLIVGLLITGYYVWR